jgi:hypothetical protein
VSALPVHLFEHGAGMRQPNHLTLPPPPLPPMPAGAVRNPLSVAPVAIHSFGSNLLPQPVPAQGHVQGHAQAHRARVALLAAPSGRGVPVAASPPPASRAPLPSSSASRPSAASSSSSSTRPPHAQGPSRYDPLSAHLHLTRHVSAPASSLRMLASDPPPPRAVLRDPGARISGAAGGMASPREGGAHAKARTGRRISGTAVRGASPLEAAAAGILQPPVMGNPHGAVLSRPPARHGRQNSQSQLRTHTLSFQVPSDARQVFF